MNSFHDSMREIVWRIVYNNMVKHSNTCTRERISGFIGEQRTSAADIITEINDSMKEYIKKPSNLDKP